MAQLDRVTNKHERPARHGALDPGQAQVLIAANESLPMMQSSGSRPELFTFSRADDSSVVNNTKTKSRFARVQQT